MLVAAVAATASAQTQYVAVIEAGQEVPPTPSTQTGLGSFTLDPFTKVLSYNITTTGLTGSFAGAHIHSGAVGSNGPILFNLSGGATSYAGSTTPLNASQENLLKTNGLYVNFHSSSFGGGEIRGQINAAQDQFMVAMNAAKEVPPSGTGATGSGTLTLNASDQVVYDINFSGIAGAFSAAHIHDGATGANGGVLFVLTLVGPGHLQGTTAALSATQRAKFRAGLLYVNVHSAGFPNGEIRGQTTSAFLNYGTGCPHAGGVATLAGGGVPTQGGTVTIAINNAPSAGSFGILFVSIASFNGSIGFGCPLYVNPAVLIPITLPLPGSSISFPSVLPTPITSGTAVNIQYVGDKGGGVPYDTNGLQMLITNRATASHHERRKAIMTPRAAVLRARGPRRASFRIRLPLAKVTPMSRSTLLLAACFALFCLRPAAAQTAFAVVLDGSQEQPPSATPQNGSGSLLFDPFTKMLSYQFTISGVTGTIVSATLEEAPIATVGPIVATLSGVGNNFSGSVGPLSATLESELLASSLYINVRSSTFVNGEIRGQIAPARDRYAVICSAVNESPPTPSSGIASGTLTLTATNQLIYDITYSGLISPYTISHIHNAPPGANGGIVFFLQQTSPGHIQGITTPVATKGLPFLRCGRFYINIHSALFQSGEIRGQILPTFLGYGTGCAALGSGGIAPTLSGDGIATPGGSITISIGGGVANSFGLLFVGIAGFAGGIGYGCPLLVHPAVLFPVPLALPAGGALTLPADLPATTPIGVAVNLQYFGDQGGGVPYGSNGLQMIVVG